MNVCFFFENSVFVLFMVRYEFFWWKQGICVIFHYDDLVKLVKFC